MWLSGRDIVFIVLGKQGHTRLWQPVLDFQLAQKLQKLADDVSTRELPEVTACCHLTLS